MECVTYLRDICNPYKVMILDTSNLLSVEMMNKASMVIMIEASNNVNKHTGHSGLYGPIVSGLTMTIAPGLTMTMFLL